MSAHGAERLIGAGPLRRQGGATLGGPTERRRTILFALLAAVVLVPAGLVTGAGLKVTKGPTESGLGTVVTAPPAAGWWTFVALVIVTIPGGLAVASTNVSSPTNLSATSVSSLAVGALTTGGTGAVFEFQLASNAPKSTELEVTFSIGLAGPATVLTVYVATPATALAGAETERLYVAAPTVAFTGFTLQSFTAISRVCSSVGVCP